MKDIAGTTTPNFSSEHNRDTTSKRASSVNRTSAARPQSLWVTEFFRGKLKINEATIDGLAAQRIKRLYPYSSAAELHE